METRQKAAMQAATAWAAEIGRMYVNTTNTTFNGQQKSNNKLLQWHRHQWKYQNIEIGKNQAAATDSEQ